MKIKHLWIVNSNQGEHSKTRCGRILKTKDTVLRIEHVTCQQCLTFYKCYGK